MRFKAPPGCTMRYSSTKPKIFRLPSCVCVMSYSSPQSAWSMPMTNYKISICSLSQHRRVFLGRTPAGRHASVSQPPRQDVLKQDIILEKCYRNSRPILATAHALGFGIYREPEPRFTQLTGQQDIGLIQMFDRKSLWEDVGYVVDTGELEDGACVTLRERHRVALSFLRSIHQSMI